MPIRIRNVEKVARIITIATLAFMVCWGLVSVIFQIRPFWVDEWRVIYNLKFKTAEQLWGPLAFLQQFPRVYLAIVKQFTAAFDYNYFSLRLPSYIVGCITILFSYRLMNRIYRRDNLNRFLFVLALISCSTFTEYFVQIKQYTMDILLSLVVLWQLMELGSALRVRPVRYVLLCLVSLLAPFFSYIYPVAIAPVYAVLLVQDIDLFRRSNATPHKQKILVVQWLPLCLCTFSITIFYSIDVSQLMKDSGMREFWGHLLMNKGFDLRSFFINCYMLFAEIGAGVVFWLLFGILGILSFLYGMYSSVQSWLGGQRTTRIYLLLYSCLLLVLVIVLYAAGKLPLGEPRLNVFTIPAISILMIHLLDTLLVQKVTDKLATGLSVLLFAGLVGNIYTTFFAAITGEQYARKMNIYRSTEHAIELAQLKQLPILISPEVAYPYDKTRNLPFSNTVPGDWVLMTFPAYKAPVSVPVYAISDIAKADSYMDHLPAAINTVMAGDGMHYRILSKGGAIH